MYGVLWGFFPSLDLGHVSIMMVIISTLLGAARSPGPLPRGTLTEPMTPGPGMRHPLCGCLYFPKQEEGSNPDPAEKPVRPQKQADPETFRRTDTALHSQ